MKTLKRTPVIMAFVLFASVSNAQIYLGYTKKEILSYISNEETYEVAKTGNGAMVLTLKFKGSENAYNRVYYFKPGENICSFYVVEPLSQNAASDFWDLCNREYKVIDRQAWRTYISGKAVEVRLASLNNKCFFYFYHENQNEYGCN